MIIQSQWVWLTHQTIVEEVKDSVSSESDVDKDYGGRSVGTKDNSSTVIRACDIA